MPWRSVTAERAGYRRAKPGGDPEGPCGPREPSCEFGVAPGRRGPSGPNLTLDTRIVRVAEGRTRPFADLGRNRRDGRFLGWSGPDECGIVPELHWPSTAIMTLRAAACRLAISG